jgi:hypothetical protein
MYGQYKLNTMSHSSNQDYSIQQNNIKSESMNIPPPSVENKYLDRSKIRHQWIIEAAYFKAEARAFKAGGELDDWLEAEQDYIESLIIEYLSTCEEDGGLNIVSLQRLARRIGIENPEKISTINQLVRSIQERQVISVHASGSNRICFVRISTVNGILNVIS